MSDPAVEARGVFKTYTQGTEIVRALRGIDLAVRTGEFLAVTGASGSGKSTLMHILGGLDRPDEGDVFIGGEAVSALNDQELALIRRRRLGFVLQFFNLLPTLSAAENAAFPLLLDGAADALERAMDGLRAVGLAQRAAHRPAQLSGGEQQRVALARALVTRPAVVFADEPTGNLDSKTGGEILQLLRAAADDGQTIVMVTHDDRSAQVADRSVRLADGLLTG
ncbi:MAG TPA: ABC transporter ATP-binding protein [Actinomycetota bacterium]|nr:ABC transporter ATP-binding protein [Actinomycetota bacterium]